ncbi:hypothetical protein HYFRA_00006951 [Hymenoscyphus fraxineus]|uniref:Uncharacterized protein n=1 Tax=Hymenoscyphus fraxineus TaxID=746836 RepID=A0A9N9KME7_9HELO|nr:hypothetical protein HYFRA_00006951 [Hymenoscyphus fraxineus]
MDSSSASLPTSPETQPLTKSSSKNLKPPKKSVSWDPNQPSLSSKRPLKSSLPPLIPNLDSKRQFIQNKNTSATTNEPLTPPTTPKTPSFSSLRREKFERFHLPLHISSSSPAPTPPSTPTTPNSSQKREHFPLIRSIARGEKPIIHKIQATVEKRRVHRTTTAKERSPLEDEEQDTNKELWEGLEEDARLMPRSELAEDEAAMSDSGMDLRTRGMERGREFARRNIGTSALTHGEREVTGSDFESGRRFPLTGKVPYGPSVTGRHSRKPPLLNRQRSNSTGDLPRGRASIRLPIADDEEPLVTMSPTQFSPRTPTSSSRKAGSTTWPGVRKSSPENSQTLPQNKPNKLSAQMLADMVLRESRSPTPASSPSSLQTQDSPTEASADTHSFPEFHNDDNPPHEGSTSGKKNPFERVKAARQESIYSRKRGRPALSPRSSSFLKPKVNAEDEPFCIKGKTLAQTNHITDFLASLDSFIQWEKRECTGLLASGSGSSFLFNLAFASSVVDDNPLSLFSNDTIKASEQEGFPWRGIAIDEFKGLYNATKTFIRLSVLDEGREFTISEVGSLQKGLLGCLDEVCDPGMVDQMPRNELHLLVPRILDVFAREGERKREEEEEGLREVCASMGPVRNGGKTETFKTIVKPEWLLIGVVILVPLLFEYFLSFKKLEGFAVFNS